MSPGLPPIQLSASVSPGSTPMETAVPACAG